MILMDSARDFSQAYNIASGSEFPLLGPDIGGFLHTGPVWFYFLAIPALSKSVIIVSLWVGFFSSLKFYLAYKLGEKVLDKTFGLLLVIATFLPGWQTIDTIAILHTNLVQTLVFAFLYTTIKLYQENNKHLLKWLFLIFSLAIQAHPSCLILATILIFILINKWKVFDFKSLTLSIVMFSLPFIPYIIDQVLTGYPDLVRISTLQNTPHTLSIFQRFPDLILSILYYGPIQISEFIKISNPLLGNIVFITYILTVVVSLAGVLIGLVSKKNRNLFLLILFIVCSFCLMILSLRSHIPYYMILVLTPFFSFFLALGLWSILRSINKTFLQFILIVFFFLHLAPIASITYQTKNDQFSIPNTINIETNIVSPKFNLEHFKTLDGLSIFNSKYLKNSLCKDIFIHGPFSVILDYTSGALTQYNCPKSNIKLGGKQNTNEDHLFIMHKSFWDQTHINPEGWIYSSLAFSYNFINHSNSDSWNIAPFDAYIHPQRKGLKKHLKKIVEYNFISESDSIIIITNILPFYIHNKIVTIEINQGNRQAELLMKNVGNWMYSCKDCLADEKIQWNIKIQTEDQNSIDINELLN